jgi:hypothetical protein
VGDHAPAERPAHIDVGGRHRRALILVVTGGDVFQHGADHGEGCRYRGLLRQAHPEFPGVGKDALPGFANHRVTDQARAAGLHADDFFVFGPDGHHGVDVAAFERLVEGGLDVLRAGEDFLVGHGQT